MPKPKYHKPRAALVTFLLFGCWVVGGAVAFRELAMLQFGGMVIGLGLATYGADVVLSRLFFQHVRPPDVRRLDRNFALASAVVGLTVGLAAPLYVLV